MPDSVDRPRTLQSVGVRSTSPAPRIDYPSPCPICEYELNGLEVGSRCPECGTNIAAINKSRDPLSTVPLAFLKSIRAGVYKILGGSVAIPILILTVYLPVTWASAFLGVVACLFAAAWVWGVYDVTVPKVRNNEFYVVRHWPRARMIIMAFSLGYLVLAAVPTIAFLLPPATLINMKGYLIRFLTYGCFATLIAFGLLMRVLARHAEWVNEISLANRFRTIAVMVPVLAICAAGVLVMAFVGLPGIIGLILLAFVAVVACIVAVVYYIHLIQLANLMVWAPINMRQNAERLSRSNERIAQRMIQAESRSTPEPVPQFNVVKVQPKGNYLPRTADTTFEDSAIDLADDLQRNQPSQNTSLLNPINPSSTLPNMFPNSLPTKPPLRE